MAKNEYGLDTSYMAENLGRILRDIERYRPDEMERALTRLADVARPSSRSPGCYPPTDDLKAFAGKACIDFYLSLHVSQLKSQSEQAKKVWTAGQDLYLATKNAG